MKPTTFIVLSFAIALLVLSFFKIEPAVDDLFEIRCQVSPESPALARFVLTNDSNFDLRIVGLNWC
jgi:hypothetical protein